jgi:glycosyltransferase involved in cell wall biosynthesis
VSVRLGIDAGNFAHDRRGMGRVARSVARAAMEDPAFDVTLLVERGRDEAGVRDAFAGWEMGVRKAASARRRGAFDVVWYPWNGMRFSAAAPTLLTVHDVFAFTEPHPGRVGRAREQAPIRRAVREATHIVAVSNWTRGELVRVLDVDPSRIEVVHWAPDAIFFPGADDLFMAAWRYVLLVGTREARKNAGVVYEACAGVFSEPRDMLVIAGQPSPQGERRLRELGVRHTIVREPDDETLRALYRNARVVAVPSTGEGFGLVAVEAMACGAPVLAANASALPETTQGAAMLLDANDVAAWSDAIGNIFRDDALAQSLSARGAAAFAFASRARPAREYLTLFRRLAG